MLTVLLTIVFMVMNDAENKAPSYYAALVFIWAFCITIINAIM